MPALCVARDGLGDGGSGRPKRSTWPSYISPSIRPSRALESCVHVSKRVQACGRVWDGAHGRTQAVPLIDGV